MPNQTNNWYAKDIEAVFKSFGVDERGLSKEEAKKRLEKYGPNELPKKKSFSAIKIFLEQFKGPLIIVLAVAAIISLFLKEFVDFGVISAAIILNTIIGFVQEYKANKSLEKLKTYSEPMATVRRDGKEMTIPSHEVVPGDIMLIDSGAKIPADGRIIEQHEFSTNEAALTGESLPIDKTTETQDKGTVLAERKDMVYLSTVAIRGKAVAIVTSTGEETELGKIAQMIREISEVKTPLQQKLSRFSKILGIGVAIISLVLFGIGVAYGNSIFEMFLTAVAVAVAAIPEGLLVAVTVVLAIGMQRILKKKALTRKLIATETLGSVSVICSDKTGTLTVGKMHMTTIRTLGGSVAMDDLGEDFKESDFAKALKAAILCNDAHFKDPNNPGEAEIIGNPTDKAIFKAGRDSKFDIGGLEEENERKEEIPFDSARRYMATRHAFDDEHDVIYAKGAPEKIFNFCTKYLEDGETKKLDKEGREKLNKIFQEMTEKGYRVLAAAYRHKRAEKDGLDKDDLRDMVFTGFFGLEDPVRPKAKETIERCARAGIRPIMITGDHMLTAKSIARQVGIEVNEKNLMNGSELDQMTDRELEKVIKDIDIFARVEPHQKVRIINAWQKHNEVVAMTGDGVNDAPALKSADIGVALGSGTDVAKENSDLVLLDDRFKTIVDAVQQGRVIFDNIRKVIVYLLTDSFSELLLITGAIVFRLPLPLLPAQILWINLVTDGMPHMALTVEPGEKDVMKRPPRKRKEPLLDKEMKTIIFIIGTLINVGLFGLYLYMLNNGVHIDHARTIIFAALGLDSLFYVYSCRSLRHSIFTRNPFSNMWLNAAVIGGLGVQLVALYVPFFQNIFHLTVMDWKDWLIIVAIGLIQILLIEGVKTAFIWYWNNYKKENKPKEQYA